MYVYPYILYNAIKRIDKIKVNEIFYLNETVYPWIEIGIVIIAINTEGKDQTFITHYCPDPILFEMEII